MSRYQYERLSGQDNDFLTWETPNLPMHVGGVQIFDAGPLRNEYGGIDFEAIKRLTASVIPSIQRYRQKLVWIPGEDHAVWADDPHFNLDYHFRHTSLPRPGTAEQLKRLTARLMEHALDRSKPLWETWVIEGLEGERFAIVNKIHHCMIDGAAGVDLSQLLLSSSPQREVSAAPNYIPRPLPTPGELRRNELVRKAILPLRLVGRAIDFLRETEDPAGEVVRQLRAAAGLARWKAFPASGTPINGPVGPHRIADWTTMALDDMRAVRRALGCTINDVVLTTATGAFRGLMRRRQVRPEKLDFRASAPVSVRGPHDTPAMGNQVSSLIVRLPLDVEDPLEQMRIVHEQTEALKASGQAATVKMLTTALDLLPVTIQNLSIGTMNTIITNVPGPPVPLYMLGAEMKQIVPFAPLIENIGLSIGVLSYNGSVSWGFLGDPDRVPDLADFRRGVERAFARLAQAAGVTLTAASAPPEPIRPAVRAG